MVLTRKAINSWNSVCVGVRSCSHSNSSAWNRASANTSTWNCASANTRACSGEIIMSACNGHLTFQRCGIRFQVVGICFSIIIIIIDIGGCSGNCFCVCPHLGRCHSYITRTAGDLPLARGNQYPCIDIRIRLLRSLYCFCCCVFRRNVCCQCIGSILSAGTTIIGCNGCRSCFRCPSVCNCICRYQCSCSIAFITRDCCKCRIVECSIIVINININNMVY